MIEMMMRKQNEQNSNHGDSMLRSSDPSALMKPTGYNGTQQSNYVYEQS